MEIVNTRLIKNFVIITCVLAILLTSIPIILYSIEFNGDFSKLHSDWGTFGDYIGGTIGTFFNLIAVVFSFFSIYITLKIATRIHENEEKHNVANAIREKEKFEREIILTEKQNRPFPVVDFNNLFEKSEIKLSNQGPGTLIVTKFEIIHGSNVYSDFKDLIHEKISDDEEYDNISFLCNYAKKYIIASGGYELLFEINKINHSEVLFEKYRNECKVFLKEAKVKLYYEDIFENKFMIEENVGF